jgi:hypothetical protein
MIECKFKFENGNFSARSDSIEDFKDGFWIDSDFAFTKADDGKFWIFPRDIIQIIRK